MHAIKTLWQLLVAEVTEWRITRRGWTVLLEVPDGICDRDTGMTYDSLEAATPEAWEVLHVGDALDTAQATSKRAGYVRFRRYWVVADVERVSVGDGRRGVPCGATPVSTWAPLWAYRH